MSNEATVARHQQACQRLDVLAGRALEIQRRLEEAMGAVQRELDQMELLEDSVHLAQLCVEEDQQRLHYVEAIITEALRAVFGSRYKFRLHEVRKGDVLTGVRPQIYNGHTWVSPEFGGGSGAMEVASAAQRLAYLVLWKPKLAPVWVADEPWARLSLEGTARLLEFWQDACKSAGIQSLIVAHHMPTPQHAAMYHVSMDESGVSHVRQGGGVSVGV